MSASKSALPLATAACRQPDSRNDPRSGIEGLVLQSVWTWGSEA